MADVRGLIAVKSQTGYGPDVLRASVSRQVGTEFVNNGIPFDVKLTNTGSQAATGCHARSEVYSRIQTIWQEYDPGSIGGSTRPATIGVPNVPVTIPAGGFKWLRVWVASQTPRDAATPDFEGEIIVDCANTAELAFNCEQQVRPDPIRLVPARGGRRHRGFADERGPQRAGDRRREVSRFGDQHVGRPPRCA